MTIGCSPHLRHWAPLLGGCTVQWCASIWKHNPQESCRELGLYMWSGMGPYIFVRPYFLYAELNGTRSADQLEHNFLSNHFTQCSWSSAATYLQLGFQMWKLHCRKNSNQQLIQGIVMFLFKLGLKRGLSSSQGQASGSMTGTGTGVLVAENYRLHQGTGNGSWVGESRALGHWKQH